MPILYYNQHFYDVDEPIVSSNDRGLLLGDGLFETIRIYAGLPIFLNRHWDRLIESAAFLEIPVPINHKKLATIINELIDKNYLKGQEASVRITLTRGEGPRGINFPPECKPTFLVSISPFFPPKEKMLSALISTIPRNEYSPLARIKSLNYLDNLLARREAEKAGFDEAILLNTAGNVCEASTANIFFIKNKIIHTPRIEDGALPGITREIILELAQKEGLQTKLISFDLKVLLSADEIFLTNSLLGVKLVGRINEMRIAQITGSITALLSKRYTDKLTQEDR
jgi:branched-chain amino acid aminotransferase